MIRLVVFDLDGTLVDSRRDIAESANKTLAACGARPLPEEEIGRMVGDGAPTLVTRAIAAAEAEKPADALERFLTIYRERLLNHTQPYPGIRRVLDQLVGRSSLAVLTNKPLDATRQILTGLNLSRYFPPDHVVGGDGPFPRKPDPTGLQHLMALADTEASATVLVGDSAIDWHAARNAAAHVCLARYGFGWEGFSVDQLDACTWIVDSPEQLLQYL